MLLAPRRELIERYVPLARRLALRYRWSGEAPDDLVPVASLAHLKIVNRWHPEMGYAFSSYAVPTILGELRRYFRDTTRIVRPPRGLVELGRLVESERRRFGAVLGREPTLAELAERLDRPHAAVTLDNLGPANLLGPEQAQIRHAADTLLFCADLPNDASARAEFAGVEALLEHLVARGRWSPERAGRLGDDVWACGPGPDAFHLLAA